MFTSRALAPFRTCSIATWTASSRSPASTSERNRAEPVTFVRSPIITNPVSGPIAKGSRPLHRVRGSGAAIRRGAMPSTAAAICRTCSGVVPQQPPTRLTRPSSANARRNRLVSPGCSSCSPIALGRPALG